MLYIKCTECGHANAMKSETILFCEKCNRKLSNNFNDWHKIHPDKSFDDFSKIHCITDIDIANSLIRPQRNKTGKIVAIVSVSLVAFILLIGFGGYWGVKKLLDNNLTTNTNKAILTGNWQRTGVGTSGLSLELPFALEKQSVDLPDSVLSKVSAIETFGHTSDKGFKVITFYSAYKNIEANLDNAVQGAVQNVQRTQGFTDFTWSRTDTLVGEKLAAIVDMRYNLLNYSIVLKCFMMCDKNSLWQVINQYSADDEAGKLASDKIIASIEIKED
jgi:hypothetical protein